MNKIVAIIPDSSPTVAAHALPASDVLRELDSEPDGLSETEVQARLARYGPNSLQAGKRVSAWKILIDQFRSVVVLLLVAAVIVAALLGDTVEAIAIVGVLIINASIGFVTELRARTAMAALLRLEVPHATVLRGGERLDVAATSLVPGDVILIEAGQAVPADARLITAHELRTNEAPLTGESLPVDKDAACVLPADTSLADRLNAIYMSTAVVAGTGRAVVTATGMKTEVGRIGTLVSGIKEERTPLEQRLDTLGRRLVWVTLAVAVVVVVLGLLRGESLGELIETALALAIAAVPEGLPTVSTIALAIGVSRMARRNALVRRLPAVESLGSATTICTDKTGTLTAGQMTVTSMWVGGREIQVSGSGYDPDGGFKADGATIDPQSDPLLLRALRVAVLANRAALTRDEDNWQVLGDPTEAALLVAAHKAGLQRDALLERYPEVGEVPFSSERMFMATLHTDGERTVAYVKGAPARVIELSARLLMPNGAIPIDDASRERLIAENRAMAARGLRVLAMASVPTDSAQEEKLHHLDFLGLVGISDPPAPGVRETIERFQRAGIRTVMITGDQQLTAEAVARQLGIMQPGDAVIEGRELAALDRQAMRTRLPHVAALSRVTPEDKLRIIEALQANGEIVAMLGDGVNDAAALKKANIGVAMGKRGTDVAKEAAAVVLQDDRFQTIGAAVEEGRVIYDNIRKFVFYLFSCNVAEIMVILGAGIAGLPQPLLPLQILWLNLITDTFPALSLAAEPGESDVMQRPPQNPQQAILSARFLRVIAFYGFLITAATLAAFIWALRDAPEDHARAMTIAFVTLAIAQTLHLGNARGGGPALRWRRVIGNRWALSAAVLTIALQLVAVYFPPLARILGVTPLSVRDWLILLPVAALPAVIGQAIAFIKKPAGTDSAAQAGST
ncbi:MAG TPA: HAD-IC family P-type ATPase [Longimicrobiales bacterium]|nr:HAD-IC family P-type ATPase [Longimicrobiales bacterium]